MEVLGVTTTWSGLRPLLRLAGWGGLPGCFLKILDPDQAAPRGQETPDSSSENGSYLPSPPKLGGALQLWDHPQGGDRHEHPQLLPAKQLPCEGTPQEPPLCGPLCFL